MSSAAPLTHWRSASRAWPRILGAEVGKGLRTQLAHPAGHVIALLVGMGMYLGLQFVLGQGELREEMLPRTLVAIGCYWFLQYSGLVMVADLVEEIRSGTLAQARMSPGPPWLLMLGRLATASVFGALVAVAATLVPLLVAGIDVPLRWEAVVPAALVAANALSFTFLLAAVALRSPMIGALQSLFTSLVLLLNGSFLPLAYYPEWLAALARLLPTTLGVEATTKVLFEGSSPAGIWADGTMPWLVAYTLALAACGGAVFVRNHRRAVRDGTY